MLLVNARNIDQQIQQQRMGRVASGTKRGAVMLTVVAFTNFYALLSSSIYLGLNIAFLVAFLALVAMRPLFFTGGKNVKANEMVLPSAAQCGRFGTATLTLGVTWGLWLASAGAMPLESQVLVYSVMVGSMFVAVGTLSGNLRWYWYLILPPLLGLLIMESRSTATVGFLGGLGIAMLGCAGVLLGFHRKAMDTAIRDRLRQVTIERQNNLMFQSGRSTIMLTTRRDLLRMTPATADLLGIGINGVMLDLRHGLNVNPAHWDRLLDRVLVRLVSSGLLSTTIRFRRPDETVLWLEVQARLLDPFQAESGIFWQISDATQRRELEEKNQFLATHDSLTGVWNRSAIDQRLKGLCAQVVGDRSTQGFCLLSLDLDGFKQVNDQHGHAIGDAVLKIVAQRLTRSLRQNDWVARVGGDEFVIVLSETSLREQGIQVSEKLIESINQPIQVDQLKLEVGVSIGIAMWPNDSVSAEALMRIADSNMYTTKQAGRNAFRRALTGFV